MKIMRPFLCLVALLSIVMMSVSALAAETLPMPTAEQQQGVVATAGQFDYYPDSTVAVGGIVNLVSGAPSNAIILAGRANLDGMLNNHVMTSAGKINFNATSQGKTVLFGGTINSSPDSHMKNGAIVIGGDVNLTGRINRDLTIIAGRVHLSGQIQGNVSIITGQLTVLPNTTVLGELNYVSASAAQISAKAKIAGGVHKVSAHQLTQTRTDDTFNVWHWVLQLAQLLVAILIINAVCKKVPYRVMSQLKSSPLKCLGVGILFMVIGALALPILVLTVVGVYLAILWGAIYILFVLFGYLYIAQSIGLLLLNLIKPCQRFWFTTLAALVGLVLISLMSMIPIVGQWITIIALIFGIGAVARSMCGKSCLEEEV